MNDQEREEYFKSLTVGSILDRIPSEDLGKVLAGAIDFSRMREKGCNEGQLETTAKNLLLCAKERGVTLSRAQRAKIRRCRKLERLDVWFQRAITVTTADEIFAEAS